MLVDIYEDEISLAKFGFQINFTPKDLFDQYLLVSNERQQDG